MKVYSTYSSWKEIFLGVLPEPIPGSQDLYFLTFSCVTCFFAMIDPVLVYHVGHSTPFITGDGTEDIIKLLRNDY